MFPIAGQTGGPIGLKFVVDTHFFFSTGNAGPFSYFICFILGSEKFPSVDAHPGYI